MTDQPAQQETQPDGSVVSYDASGHALRQTWPDGRVTTFQYRGDDYVATTGDQHVLYDANGTEIKQWQGSDESSASVYHALGHGHYSLTDPSGVVSEYGPNDHLVRQTAADGQVTTFQYRGDNYVATTGDQHVLYDASGTEIKQWQGSDESSASVYHALGHGHYSLTDPSGVVSEYGPNDHLVRQTAADGQVTTFQYRGDNYVATTGDQHVLYDADGDEIKQWRGNDESSAQSYHQLQNGDYTLTDPDGATTEYGANDHLVRQTAPDGQVTTFQYRGDDYVATTGDQHVLYDASGTEVKQWQGSDEASAQFYHQLGNGDYTLTDPDGATTEYGPNDHLVRQTAADGQVTTFQYRGDNYVATTGDQHVLYDADGDEIKQWQGNDESSAQSYHQLQNGDYTLTDPDGATTEYGANDHLVRQTAPDGQVTTFQYRGDNYVATTGDQHVLYDASGTEVKQWQGSDEASAQFYHQLGNGDYTLTDPDGTSTEYSPDGHLVEQTDHGAVTTFQYRGDDYVATTGDQHVLYDEDGTEIKQWQGNDESSAQSYHQLQNGDYTLTDPKGTVTEYASDGRLVRQTGPDGQVTTFQYRGDNYVATTGDQHVLYDADGDEIKQWQGDDESSAQQYHQLSNGDYTLTDPKGTVTEYASDGRLVRQTGPDGQVTTFQYRGNNYVATTGDQHVLYDANGDEIKQWQGNDESSAQDYHQLQNGDYTLTDSKGTVTEYTSAGRLVRQTAPDGAVTTFQYRGDNYVATTGDQHVLYDANGDEIKQWQGDDESSAQQYHQLGNGDYTLTDPKGTVTEYTSAGRLVRQTAPDGTVTTFQYRGDNYVATTGDQHVLYDGDGNEIKQWQGDDESSAKVYHQLGDGHYTLTDPDGTVTEYNGNDQAIKIQQPGQPPQTIQWLPNGDYIVTQGNGHSKFNTDGQLLESWDGSDESVADHYTYLPNGDLVITGPEGSTEYGPDGKPITTTEPDGTTIVWKADLAALQQAINTVQTERDAIETDLRQVKNVFTNIQDVWQSPAGNSFGLLSTDFTKATTALQNALDEALRRMRSSYQNYVDSETKNASIISQISQEGHKLAGQSGGAS